MFEYIKTFFEGLFGYASRVFLFLIGALWGLLEPTIPFAGICLLAILIDCFTAWRLGKRVKAINPKAKADDAKFKSNYARRMFYTLCVVYACTVLGWLIDTYMYPFVDLYIANFISGGFCLVQLLSILENESSCNDARWAKVLQKVLVNKAARHLDVDDLKLITDDDAVKVVMKPHFWDRWKADQIKSQSVANILVDWVWGSGVNGIKPVQQLLGVTVDGIVGAKTLAALNAREPKLLFAEIKKARVQYIQRLVKRRPSQKVFENGWLRRLNSINYGSLTTNRAKDPVIKFQDV